MLRLSHSFNEYEGLSRNLSITVSFGYAFLERTGFGNRNER